MTLLVILLFFALLVSVVAGAVAYTHVQVWRERAERHEDEAAVFAELLSESQQAYAGLQSSLRAGEWVRIPTNEEIDAGRVR